MYCSDCAEPKTDVYHKFEKRWNRIPWNVQLDTGNVIRKTAMAYYALGDDEPIVDDDDISDMDPEDYQLDCSILNKERQADEKAGGSGAIIPINRISSKV